MIERHLMKLRARDEIDAEEVAAIRAAVSEQRRYGPDQTIVPAHRPVYNCTILLTGLAARARDLRDGGRQLTELHVPGDFMDLHSFTLKRLDQAVVAISECVVALVPHARVKEMTETLPHLTRIYWFATNLDAAIHREWAVSLGSRSALEALQHLFCELHLRLEIVGLVDGDGGFALPATQTDLAQCLGMTPVHMNRTVQHLRASGLADFQGGRVRIADINRLRAACGFDPGYLYLERQLR